MFTVTIKLLRGGLGGTHPWGSTVAIRATDALSLGTPSPAEWLQFTNTQRR